jgi:vesicle-fusing ATPase
MGVRNNLTISRELIQTDVSGIALQLTVKLVQLGDLSQEKPSHAPPTSDPNARGILTRATQITFHKDGKTPINLKASMTRSAGTSIVAPE